MSHRESTRQKLAPALARAAYWMACVGGLAPWAYATVLVECDGTRQAPAWLRLVALGWEPLAVALACVALALLRHDTRPQAGRPYAWGALGVALLACCVTLPTAKDFDDHWLAKRSAMFRLSCLSNLKQLGLATLMYAQDNDDRMPATSNWNAAIRQTLKRDDLFVCPNEVVGDSPSYAMNRQVGGLETTGTSEQEVVQLYDSTPGRNQAGGPEMLPVTPRHGSGDMVAFLDGHARYVARSAMRSLTWSPRQSAGAKEQR